MTDVLPWQLRAAFARSLSDMYGTEVPAYTTLLGVAHAVNADVMARAGADAERLGSIARVSAERHGAIRVGTPAEMAQLARIFGAMGMAPVGFYDLREATGSPIPVVSTAFRPTAADELARNPFRVFTSLLTPSDRRFFSADLAARLEAFLATRELFGPELLALADRAEAGGGLSTAEAERFLTLATAAFELSREPVDRAWYTELEAVSAVAADIGGLRSTHINHLTPRVLDIDDLYARMQDAGITMIDQIQGPPRWEGPDVLLRQTSFRALAEPRAFRDADGTVRESSLRVRFGEVEARGIALTGSGRALYDALVAEVDATVAAAREEGAPVARADVARRLWRRDVPASEVGLAEADLAFFAYAPTGARPPVAPGGQPPRDLAPLVAQGWLEAAPIVYEDFLPQSAAGIFASNLSRDATVDAAATGTVLDEDWMAGVLGRPLADPTALYAAQRQASLADAAQLLGLPPIQTARPTPTTTGAPA